MLRGKYLHKIRIKALRHQALGVLSDLERGILTLSSRILDKARDPELVAQLISIIKKLENATVSGFKKHINNYGTGKLVTIVKTALKFGSKIARNWILDKGFTEYLAFIDYNR